MLRTPVTTSYVVCALPRRHAPNLVAIVLLACAVARSASGAQLPAQRYALTPNNVLIAMMERGLPTKGVQLRLAAPVTSSVQDPELDIQSIIVGDHSTAHLLVACRDPSGCIPFYISAIWPSNVDLSGLQSSRTMSQSSTITSSQRTTTLRPGVPAILLLDSDRVHVRLSVVCLEFGEPGTHVRVTTPDRRHAYQAEVSAPGLLKGTF